MTNGFKFLSAAALALGFAMPAAAADNNDVLHLVCGEFLNMDDAGKIGTATNMLTWIADNNNAEMVGNLVGLYPLTTEPTAFVANISEACIKQPYTTNIIAQMQAPH
jgi:hypothetical protein